MPERVLVIDDDRDLAWLTTLWVRAAGFEAVMARDGAAGLKTAHSYRPDIILLDIMMPGIDGFEVSRQLKQDPELSRVPVIFLSAKVQETARREAFAAGAKYFLSKPYQGANLVDAITSALCPCEAPQN